MFSGEKESLSPSRQLGIRPFCSCCAGGEFRKGKTHCKAVSRKLNNKSRRAKPKYKSHRN